MGGDLQVSHKHTHTHARTKQVRYHSLLGNERNSCFSLPKDLDHWKRFLPFRPRRDGGVRRKALGSRVWPSRAVTTRPFVLHACETPRQPFKGPDDGKTERATSSGRAKHLSSHPLHRKLLDHKLLLPPHAL